MMLTYSDLGWMITYAMGDYTSTTPYCVSYDLCCAPDRMYSPNSAKWTIRDPLGMVDGPNTYGYVGGMAIHAADPLGLWETCGNCGGEGDAIKKQVDSACGGLDSSITDPQLLECIKKRCKNSKVKCEHCQGDSLGHNDYWEDRSGNHHHDKHINICTKNTAGKRFDYEKIAVHEWAHSCGWEHNDGDGVPGDNGHLPEEP